MYIKFLRFTLLFMAFFPSAYANMDQELSGIFADMINATPGGSYDTQRRSVLSGGSIVTRNKITHPNLISFVPPSARAGCNGIDLFGGSLSFISADQFVALLRNIAQASVGYAFHLAIEGMCPTCAQVMTKLQSTVQDINKLMRNSCETGKFFVDNTIGPGLKSVSKTMKDSLTSDLVSNPNNGFLSDWFGTAEDKSNDPFKKAIDQGKQALFQGNVVYESLNSADAISWYAFGDEEWKMVMMSLTGTYVTDKNDDNTSVQFYFRPHTIDPHDFIEGGTLTIYQCESSQCLLPGKSTKTITVTGMRERVRKMIFGTGTCSTCSGGMIRKLHERTGGQTLTDEEKRFANATSPGIYGILQRLANEPNAAVLVAEQLNDLIAVELTNRLVNEIYDTVRNAVLNTGQQLDTKILGTMRDREEKLREERRITGQALAGVTLVLNTYSAIEQDLRAPIFHQTQ